MKYLLFIFAIFVSLVVQADAENAIPSDRRAVDFPDVPEFPHMKPMSNIRPERQLLSMPEEKLLKEDIS